MGLIRCLLALAVIVTHTTPLPGLHPVDGYLAVQTFYIISGFYMALILNEKYLPENSTYGVFLRSRLLRLFPLYWLVLALTLLTQALWPAVNPPLGQPLGSLAYWLRYAHQMTPLAWLSMTASNLLLLGQDWLRFFAVKPGTGSFVPIGRYPVPGTVEAYHFFLIPQAWTLGIELTFYLLAPFLVRRSVRTLLALIGLSIGLRVVLRFGLGLDYDPWTARFFPTELVFFLVGAVAYRGYRALKGRKRFDLRLSWAALAVAVLFILFYNAPLLAGIPGRRAIYFLAMAVAFPMIFLLTKNNRRDRSLGDLSYPIYIVHVLALEILRLWGLNTSLATFAVTALVSWALLEAIDRPVEQFRQHLFERQKRLAEPEAISLP